MAEEETDSKPEGEENEGGAEGLQPPKKNTNKKMLLIGLAAGALLIGGIGAGLFFAGVIGGHEPTEAEMAAEGEAGGHAAKPEAKASAHGEPAAEGGHGEGVGAPVFFSLGDILVNLTGDGKRPSFLKIKISLELASEKDKEELGILKPRIIDNFQVYLRELRVEDLRGSAGLYRLREELLLRVTETAKPIRVKDVLFQEMLVQ